jgi:two-component system heavy metal sensor histidine kinase CusS
MRLPFGRSVTARLTLLFAAVSSSVLLALGLIIASLVEHHFEDMDLELLEGKLELIRHAVVKARASGDLDALAEPLEGALVGHHGLAVGVWQADGRPVYVSPDAAFPPESIPPAGQQALPLTWASADGQRYRGIQGLAPTGRDGEAPARVAVSTALAHHDHFMQSFRLAMWTVVSVAALLSGLLGWAAARRGLAPLRDIVRHAADITASKLDQRLADDAIPEELAEVVRTLNAMLARLESSFQRLSDFSSDIAHELRTPVSNLLTQTQVTLSRARSLAEYQDVLASNAEEFERLSRTIADMLFLAKADNRLLIPTREAVHLDAEVRGLLEFYEALAEDKALALSCTGSADVTGDRLMLRRAISNLLSNAVRHTPPHGHVSVALATDGEMARIRVGNSGPGIAPDHLPRLFDRFYRADASRQHSGEGSGLGLAISLSILQAHGGGIEVPSADGLTVFEARLPLTPPAP